MNDVRTIRADSMQEALKLVRQELGDDAVILHTRQVDERNRLPWRKKRRRVEITAGQGVNSPSVIAARSRGLAARGSATVPRVTATETVVSPLPPTEGPLVQSPRPSLPVKRPAPRSGPPATTANELTQRLDSMQR